MGVAPSILTVPSTSISRDIEALKALCPSRFRVEKPSSDATNSNNNNSSSFAVLTDKNGSLTLILVAIPVPAANRLVANRVTFVLQESELRSVVNRCEDMRLLTNLVTEPRPVSQQSNAFLTEAETFVITMAELSLPGGAGVALVSPSGAASRQELGQKLADSLTKSLPKGIARSKSISSNTKNSSKQLQPQQQPKQPKQQQPKQKQQQQPQKPRLTISSSPRRPTPERRESFGTRRSSGSTPRISANSPHRSLSPCPATPSRHHQNFATATTKFGGSPSCGLLHDRPSFPTLKINSLHLNGKYKTDFGVNARVSIPVETELFVGQMVFLIRPPDDTTNDANSYWNERVFANKKRRVMVQVQGKFKYEPKGIVFAGLEASKELRLGRLSKGLSGLFLKWAQDKSQNMYHSFGTEKEKARVVVPAHTFFDRVVVTPPGCKPPNILEPLNERQEEKDLRMKQQQKTCSEEHPYHPNPHDCLKNNNNNNPRDSVPPESEEEDWNWNINDMYSMSFCTSNLDLPTWSLLDVPELGNLGLKALIGNSMLRFVMYENLTTPEKGGGHLQHYLRYAYVIQFKFLGSRTSNDAKQHDEEAFGILDWVQNKSLEKSANTTNNPSKKATGHNENAEDETEEKENDALALKTSESDKFPTDVREADVVVDKEYEEFLSDEADVAIPDQRPKISSAPFDDLAVVDTLCPAWIEMCASQGKYTRAYAFNVNGRTVFRTPQSFRDLLGVGKYLVGDETEASMDRVCSPRMSSAERTRRLFGKMLEVALRGKNADSLKRMMELYSSQFLRRRETSFPEKEQSLNETKGIVARALSDRHWIEEWTEVSADRITFAHPDSRKLHFAINLECIVAVRSLESDEGPIIHNCCFMVVETLGRATYIMFATEADRKKCFDAIVKAATSVRAKKDSNNKPQLYLNLPREEFTRKSTMWACGNRLIMNTRQMSFRAPLPSELLDPLEVVEDALRKALHRDIEKSDAVFQSFLDRVAQLKNVCVNHLREDTRLAFFLNLYHVMVTHAALVVGATDSQYSLVNRFSCLSYQTCDDIFSISELEHCILRAQMTRLAPLVPSTNAKAPPAINSRLLKATSPFRTIPPVPFRFTTPNSKFCFALQKADFRLNFAINCGSTSNPAEIPIYSVEMLQQQLDEACKLYLHNHIAIKKRNKHYVCVLPRLCQWYAEDFGSTNYSVLKTLEPYVHHHERKILASSDFASLPITPKYLSFSFDCRKLVSKEEQFYTATGTLASSGSSEMSTVSSSVMSGPMTLSDGPISTDGENDIDSLLDFLMDDALEIPTVGQAF